MTFTKNKNKNASKVTSFRESAGRHTLLLTRTSHCTAAQMGAYSWSSPADRRHAGYWVRLVTVGRLC